MRFVAALPNEVREVIAAALDDGHGDPESEQDPALVVYEALCAADFDITKRLDL